MPESHTENLTERQAAILKEIATASGFVTFSTLARPLDVSSRTIIRELDNCLPWLTEAGIILERKASQGIRLVSAEKDRKRLRNLLDGEMVNYVYSTPDRLLFLRQSLLRENDPVKLFTFSRRLKVAESTISSDLGRLDAWFANYRLDLVRRPGLGIYLDGSETDKRQALKDLLHEVWNENSLIEMMLQPTKTADNKRVRNLLDLNEKDLEHMRTLIQIVEVWEKQNQLVHRERNFLNLVLQLIVLTWRQFHPDETSSQAKSVSHLALGFASSLLDEIAQTLQMPWLTREVYSVAAQLPMLYPEIPATDSVAGEHAAIDTTELARKMISLVQSETGYAISDEDFLVESLASHLLLAITRLQFNQMIHNPLEKEIREQYPQWFELAKKCSGLIEQLIKIPVPNAETAYLTLYLGAAMEKAATRSGRHYHIAVLCPSGMSSSVLLASRVEVTFPQVTVDAIVSFKQATEIVHQQHFDLILSTADIKLPGIPVLTVRPFLPADDQEKLRNFLDTLVPRRFFQKSKDSDDLLSRLERFKDLSSGLYSLLSHFFCLDCDCSTLESAIELAAQQVQPENPAAFTEALHQRESLGHVILGDLQMALLHTRTTEITELYFGLLRPRQPLIIDNQTIRTILIMAAPLAVAPVKLEIMQLISRSIIDDDQFSNSLQKDAAVDIYHQLERLLNDNYTLTLNSAEQKFKP